MVLFDVGVYDSAKEVAIVLIVGGVVATSVEVLPRLVMSGPLGLLGFFIWKERWLLALRVWILSRLWSWEFLSIRWRSGITPICRT